MVSEKRQKKRGDKVTQQDPNKLTKEEEGIAKYIRFNCPTNTTMFEGNEVHYFTGRKAVDLLVNYKKYGAGSKTPKFKNDADAEDFLRNLLDRGLFFRAKKLVLKKKGSDGEKENKSTGLKFPKDKVKAVEDIPISGSPRRKNKKDEEEKAGEEEEKEENEEGADRDDEKEKKRKKKVKLYFQDAQYFVTDSTDVYVWVFDPTPFYKQFIGICIVLGTIVGCLFPLWPDWLRLGVYYASLTGLGLFGLLIGTALFRTAIFAMIWACTLGRHHLWILPNLTEDCGFFESFKPLYTYEYVIADSSTEDSKKKEKKKEKKITIEDQGEKTNDQTKEKSQFPLEKNKPVIEEDDIREGSLASFDSASRQHLSQLSSSAESSQHSQAHSSESEDEIPGDVLAINETQTSSLFISDECNMTSNTIIEDGYDSNGFEFVNAPYEAGSQR